MYWLWGPISIVLIIFRPTLEVNQVTDEVNEFKSKVPARMVALGMLISILTL